MGFNKDWFCFFGEDQGVSASSGGTACSSGFPTFKTFPGCSPDGTYYHFPYDETSGRGAFRAWILPHAAVISQFIGSNYTFGSNDGAEGTDYRFYIRPRNGPLKLTATELYTSTERINDRGSVWDVNKVVLAGTEIQILFRQWKGPNQNNNSFVIAMTGTWLRE